MAIYHIVRWDKPEEDKAAEPWQQKPSRKLARDLDLALIEELNKQPEEDESPHKRWRRAKMTAIIAAIAVAAFVFMSFANIISLDALPDLGFLHQSEQLSTDPMVADLKASVVSIKSANSQGTGFNIDPSGVIVTNKHVVAGKKLLTVTFPNGDSYMTKDWQTKDNADLALVYIKGTDLPCVSLATTSLVDGDSVIFIGNPLGFDWTVGQGKVLDNAVYLNDFELPVVMISGTIYPGSSGSPVFNTKGEVAAVVFATLTDRENTGLAIPIGQLYQ